MMKTFEEHQSEWKLQHPSSIPKLSDANTHAWWYKGMVGLMFIAAALFSGVHTVITVYQGIDPKYVDETVRRVISILSFIAVDFSFFIASIAIRRGNKRNIIIMMIIVFAVALIANVNSELKALDANKDADIGTLLGGLALGIGAPLLAMLAGHTFVNIREEDIDARRSASKDYDKALKTMDRDILTSYRQYVKAFQETEKERKREEREEERSLRSFTGHSLNGANEQENGERSLNSANGYTKQMSAREYIQKWLSEHPEWLDKKVDEIWKAFENDTGVKVGRTSVHNVRSEILNFKNGNVSNE